MMWHFFSPKLFYGEGALAALENIKGEKCFIVTDNIMEDLGFVKILIDTLEKYGKDYIVFKDVIPDPHEEDVMKGKDVCIDYAPNLIIALGGGSVIDTAKVIWAMYEYPEFTLDDINFNNPKLFNFANKAKLIAIPSTSGTGADTTWAAVISRYENNVWRKGSFAHESLVPTYAILDPVFPKSMTTKLTVNTAFDALAHSLEGYISAWRNEFSNALIPKAIELIFKYLPIAYEDGNNMEARDFLHQAASMAGIAFSNSQIHIVHAMGHSFGAIFPIPHGGIVGIFLPYVLQYCLNAPGDTNESIILYSGLAKKLGWAKWEDEDKSAANKVVEKIKELQKIVNFSSNLKDLGIKREDFDKNLSTLISLCYQDPSGAMAPRSPTKDDFIRLYTYAYDGKEIDF
ncbi:MAG: iron-containing alcohol dehydrogenase [Promethearchaeota archaeon]|nr:MAG: iron-containing alcohol dehydrogenase [Candidatus Lokiarchaeota archaeon]